MSARTFGLFVCLKLFGIISPLEISITVYCIFSRHVYDNIFFLHLWVFFFFFFFKIHFQGKGIGLQEGILLKDSSVVTQLCL